MSSPVFASVTVELDSHATAASFEQLKGIAEAAAKGIAPVTIKLDTAKTKSEFKQLSSIIGDVTSKLNTANVAAQNLGTAKPDAVKHTVDAYKQLLDIQNKIKTYSKDVQTLSADPSKNAAQLQNAISYLKQYKQQYDELLQKSSKDLSRDQIDKLTKNFQDLSEVLDKINAKRTDKAVEHANKESQKAAEQELATQNKLYSMLEKAQSLRRQAVESQNGPNTKTVQDLDDLIAKLEYLRDNFGSVGADKAAQDLKEYGLALRQISQEGKNAGDFTKRMTDGFADLESYVVRIFSLTRIMMTAVRQFKEMVKTTTELDSAMTQLRVVTSNTEAEYSKYWQTTSSTAKEIGASITDLIDSTTVFARLGYSLDESSELARLTAMLKNVGDIDVSSAQNALTAITKAFKDVDSSNIESAMDKMVEVGNNFPISVSQLAEGLNNAGSALSASGNSFEQSIALLTAANTTVQNISKSSTGLRTIAARIRKTKTELDDLGETITEATYQKALDMLTGKGVRLTDENGFRSTYDILKDIADIWDELGSTSQAAVAEALAGNRQQNVFFSIVEQFQEATSAMDAMRNSAGSLSEAYGEYMDSIQAHTDMFKAAFQDLSRSIIDSDAAKTFIDNGANILRLFTGINNVLKPIGGMLPSVLGLLSGMLAANWGSIAKISGLAKLAEGIKGIATASKALSASGGGIMSLLSSFASPAGIGIAVASITAIVSAISQFKKHQEDLRAAAAQNARDYLSGNETRQSSINDYIQEVDRLKAKIAEGKLSQDELYDTQERLLSIQGELTSAFGQEASGIDLLTSSAEEAKKALQDLNTEIEKNAANNFLTENKNEFDKARREMEETRSYKSKLFANKQVLDTANAYERLLGIADAYDEITISTAGAESAFVSFDLEGQARDADKALHGFAEDLRELKNELISEGVFDEAISKQFDYMESALDNYVTDNSKTINKYAETYDAGIDSLIKTNDRYNTAYAAAAAAQEQLDQAMSGTFETPKERAQAIETAIDAYKQASDTLGNTNFAAGDSAIKANISSMLDGFTEIVGVVDQLKAYSEGGGVDLLVRPVIPAKALSDFEKAGFHIGDGTATVFSSTVSNAAGQYFNFTPILTDEDGNYIGHLTPEELDRYASEVIEGVHPDDKHLQIGGAFDSQEAAEEAANLIHVLQEIFFDGIDSLGYHIQEESVRTFASIKEYIEQTKTALSDLSKATSESLSSTGMTAESVDKVRAMFAEVKGFDPNKLFTMTGTGVRMNTTELTNLTNQYVELRKQKIEDDLRAWSKELVDLESKMSKLTKAEKQQEEAKKDSERIDALKNDILQARVAYAEITALTNAYNRYLQAKSRGDKSDPYGNIKNDYKNIKDYIDRGMYNADVVTEYLNTVLGDNRSGNNKKDFGKLKKKIKGTDYNLMDFFSVDDNGKATSEGIDNFVKALAQLSDAGKISKGIIKDLGNGKYSLDFTNGGFEEVANAMGIGYDAFLLLGEAMQDAGWKVNFEDIIKNIYDVKKASEETKESIEQPEPEPPAKLDVDDTEANSKLEAWKQKLEELTSKPYPINLTAIADPILAKLLGGGGGEEPPPASEGGGGTQNDQPEFQPKNITPQGKTTAKYISDAIANTSSEIIGTAAQSIVSDLSTVEGIVDSGLNNGEVRYGKTEDGHLKNGLEIVREAMGMTPKDWGLQTFDTGSFAETFAGIKNFFSNLNDIGNTPVSDEGLYNVSGIITDAADVASDVSTLPDAAKTVGVKEFLSEAATSYADTAKRASDVQAETFAAIRDVITGILDGAEEVSNYADERAGQIEQDGSLWDYTGGNTYEPDAQPEQVPAELDLDTGEAEDAIDDISGKEVELNVEVDKHDVEDQVDDALGEPQQIEFELGSNRDRRAARRQIDELTSGQDENAEYEITINGLEEGIDNVAQLGAEMSGLPGVTSCDVTDNGTALSVTGDVQSLYAALAALPSSKTITISLVQNGSVPQFATGTKNAPGGIALVNEEGPEIISDNGTAYIANGGKPALVNLSKGAIVLNADETRDALGGRGIGKPINAYKAGFKPPTQAVALLTLPSSPAGLNPRTTTIAIANSSSGGKPSFTATGSIGNGKKKDTGSGYGGGGGGQDKEEEEKKEKIDWIEVAIDRIERAIDDLADVVASSFKTLAKRLKASVDEVSKIQEEITLAEQGAARYFKEADSVGLSNALKEKAKNGTIDIKEYDKDTADKINEYLKWYEKGLDLQQKVAELHENIAEIYQDRFDMVQDDYEKQLDQLEHQIEMQEKNVDMVSARGYLESTKFYEAMSEIESQRIAKLREEMQDLKKYFDEAIASGEIDEGSEAWYEMSQEIDEVAESIAEANVQLAEYEQTMRTIKWDTFDYAIERFDQLSEEAEFFIDLMSNDILHQDNGQLTDAGMATLGMHALNFDAFMQKADEYAKELENVNKMLEEDPYDTSLVERREELLSLQRDSITAAEDEKNAVQDLVSEGIEKELDALKELIDAYKESLDSAKDLYDYQQKLAEKSADIASIQKQLSAYAGDNSEENRSRIQKLQKDLEKAQKDLQEEERDHSIEDQKKILDDLYDEYEDLLNKRIDDVNKLMQDMIDLTNEHMAEIKDKIDTVAAEVGYTVSEGMTVALDGMFAYYDQMFKGVTSVSKVLDGIYNIVGAMAEASGAIRAYSSGGIVDYTGLAMLHGSPGSPEMVLNPSDTERFLQLVSAMHSVYDVGDVSSKDIALKDTAGAFSETNIGSINLGISIDHVQDYNDFVTQLRDDPKFEKLIHAMTLDQALGKSALGKNKINF